MAIERLDKQKQTQTGEQRREMKNIIRSTVLGEVVQKPSWGKDQPNNYNGEQNCVVLDGGRNWLWNDVGCNLDYLHWICQSSECHLFCINM